MIIYKITNKVNGMCYVGKTGRSLLVRWNAHIRDARCKSQHCKFKLQKAIQEYGESCFTVEQIDIAATPEEANRKEMYWIKFFDCIEHGYNTSPGGKNGGSRRKVQCVETGIVYDTMIEAGKAVGVSYSAIRYALDKPHLTSAGSHWVSVKKP